jgi:hypothetical protein
MAVDVDGALHPESQELAGGVAPIVGFKMTSLKKAVIDMHRRTDRLLSFHDPARRRISVRTRIGTRKIIRDNKTVHPHSSFQQMLENQKNAIVRTKTMSKTATINQIIEINNINQGKERKKERIGKRKEREILLGNYIAKLRW